MDLRKQNDIVTPSEIVNFDQDTPTTGGVVFDPNTPTTTDILYVSSTNASTWIYNGSSYVTYDVPKVETTPFYLTGTTIDAGGNKTASITRNGQLRTFSSNGGYTLWAENTNTGTGAGIFSRINTAATGVLMELYKGVTEIFKVDNNGKISASGTYQPNVQSVVSSATVTPNADTDDEVVITAQAEALIVANPSGTPTDGQPMFIRIYDDGTARAITWGAGYLGTGLPTTTVVGTSIYVPIIYNSSTSKWENIDQTGVINSIPTTESFACSDETTALTTGTAKVTFRMPYAMTVTEVRGSLTGAGSTSGATTIDINEGGVSILSTKLTIDFGDTTSVGATTPAVISDSALADNSVITVDIDGITGGADETGLKVYLIGTRLL